MEEELAETAFQYIKTGNLKLLPLLNGLVDTLNPYKSNTLRSVNGHAVLETSERRRANEEKPRPCAGCGKSISGPYTNSGWNLPMCCGGGKDFHSKCFLNAPVEPHENCCESLSYMTHQQTFLQLVHFCRQGHYTDFERICNTAGEEPRFIPVFILMYKLGAREVDKYLSSAVDYRDMTLFKLWLEKGAQVLRIDYENLYVSPYEVYFDEHREKVTEDLARRIPLPVEIVDKITRYCFVVLYKAKDY